MIFKSSRIIKGSWAVVDKTTSEVKDIISLEEARKLIKESSKEDSSFSLMPMAFRYLSEDDKKSELLEEMLTYKENFDSTDHGGRAIKDVFVLDRERYEYIIEALKNKGEKKHEE